MKKIGFTLAEILIALTIVGVVAAISLPTLGVNAKKQANEAKLKVVISDLENAFSTMITSEIAERLQETKAWNGDASEFIDEYSKYLKISSKKTGTDDGIAFTTKNGALVEIIKNDSTDSNGNIGFVYIDVNGNDKPNKKESDQFECNLDQYGMLEQIDTQEEQPQ